ncbi:uncharacterized protein LOC131155317 [Malania oleifera]|uniref:uncharacterized protein LOC131155317 n=1 Tax=Malania oleifera TaxID=397392 RepID=UPI0025AE8B9C|nr:uncharacterized protein LOC131155317 [Malania oleifera]
MVMEMAAIHLDKNMEVIEDDALESLLSQSSSNEGGIFGNPDAVPRVGDDYQAEIPPLMDQNDCLELIEKTVDTKAMVDIPSSFLLGLLIPIMWTHCEVDKAKQEALELYGNQDTAMNTNRALKFKISEENQITSNNEGAGHKVEVRYSNNALHKKKEMGMPTLQPTLGTNKMDVDLILSQEKKFCPGERHCCPFPGSSSETWGDIEHDSFVLGLYIFGKNLLLVKRFVGSKGMGDILSFYYGKFYRSDAHRRWSDCRKIKSRRCAYGQRIFAGWRQQELLSRLSSRVSKECQDMLVQVSRTFGEGKLSLEEYVFSLRNTVGINLLVEAVGIGQEKRDLTRIASEHVKTNHVFSVRSEIPIGKACSALTSGDIIKFLSGDFRLSKARSSDLFWEAVWPRLLARGWHSEQPKDHGLSASKNYLVFLIPGVKKFSRKRLVKGNHYYDSVSDVLNKVASEPGLLELEIEPARGCEHDEENRWDRQIKQDPYSLPNQQRHSTLQPLSSRCNRDVMKFTIVDTSLVYGEQPKVRELRSLPVDSPNDISTPEIEQQTSEESQGEAELMTNSNPAENEIVQGVCTGSAECITSVFPTALGNSTVAIENHDGQSACMPNEKQSRKAIKYQFSRKVKHGHAKDLAPVKESSKITAINHEELSCSIENIPAEIKLNREESHCQSNSPDASENMDFQVITSQNLSSANSLARDGPDESIDGNCLGTEVSTGKAQPPTMVNLNLPHVPPDFGTDEPFVMDMVHNHDEVPADKSSFISETNQRSHLLKNSIYGGGLQANGDKRPINGRRQSTRNRPLSTKALEALACDFLSTQRKRKRVDFLPQNNPRSKSSQHILDRSGGCAISSNVIGNDVVGFNIEKRATDAICTSNSNIVSRFQV